jgi:hypothetical protein
MAEAVRKKRPLFTLDGSTDEDDSSSLKAYPVVNSSSVFNYTKQSGKVGQHMADGKEEFRRPHSHGENAKRHGIMPDGVPRPLTSQSVDNEKSDNDSEQRHAASVNRKRSISLERTLFTPPTETCLHMSYTISQDTSMGADAQEKRRLLAVRERAGRRLRLQIPSAFIDCVQLSHKSIGRGDGRDPMVVWRQRKRHELPTLIRPTPISEYRSSHERMSSWKSDRPVLQRKL